jgi:hypothetical protein
VRTISDIKADLERAIARRAELWEALAAEGHDPDKSAEAARLTAEIEDLWAEQRALHARLRNGPAELIHARARAEERLERDSRRVREPQAA